MTMESQFEAVNFTVQVSKVNLSAFCNLSSSDCTLFVQCRTVMAARLGPDVPIANQHQLQDLTRPC